MLARLQRLAVRLAREVLGCIYHCTVLCTGRSGPASNPTDSAWDTRATRYCTAQCTPLTTDLVWQEGLLRPGWCSSGWWQILWRQNDTHAALLDSLLASIQQ